MIENKHVRRLGTKVWLDYSWDTGTKGYFNSILIGKILLNENWISHYERFYFKLECYERVGSYTS